MKSKLTRPKFEENIEFNTEQKKALDLLYNFVSSEEEKFFVLNGYAGTGKTTLIKELADYCLDRDIPFILLASTGRAAKVLSRKTGYNACTVHRHIYMLDVSELDDKSKSKKVKFRLVENIDPESAVYIIDESSMLSDKQLVQTLSLFGSGSLLDDFVSFTGKRKIVFVGDNAQLPPINSSFCPALDLSYLAQKYCVKGASFNLKKIERFDNLPVIKLNAEFLLNVIRSENYNTFMKIRTEEFENVKVFSLDSIMIEDYVNKFKRTSIDECIFVTYSNKLASSVNREIRAFLYGDNQKDLYPGEVLMVQQNNYLHNVANGEHIEVKNVTGEEHKRAGLSFLPVEAEINEASGKRKFECLLMKDYLNLGQARLSNEFEYALTVDFIIRMKKKGIESKSDSILFKEMLMNDPYLNSIRSRYGYAVTCHKAQGGEWQNVYIVFEKSLWHPNNIKNKFRWVYTALTRTQTNLYLLDNIAII